MKTRARAETSRRIVDAARRTVAAVVFVAAVAAPLLSPPAVTATSDFAAQTGKDCAYCHVTPGGPLAAAGVEFREDGYRLPPEGGPTTTTTTSAVDDGPTTTDSIEPASDDVQDGGPILDLPRSERLFFRWLHILAAVAWLGGIISVFVVQTPQVAFAGIPTRYLALAWPSLLVTGVTGVVLTLAAVQDFGALSETRWGRILLLKMALYLALLVIALLATFVIGPRLKKASSSRPSRGRSQEQYRAQGRVTVQYRGRVYDVTGSRLWPEGRHARRHDAWQDLTSVLSGAPHGPEALERFTAIAGGDDDGVPLALLVFVNVTRLSFALVVVLVFLVAIW